MANLLLQHTVLLGDYGNGESDTDTIPALPTKTPPKVRSLKPVSLTELKVVEVNNTELL